MENIQEKAYFNFGSSEYYEGYHIDSRRWNGFATPCFEKDIADIIAHNCTAKNVIEIEYNKKKDCYIIKEFQDGKVTSTEYIYKSTINTKDGNKEVYNIGSFSWTWNSYTLEEIQNKDKNSIHIISMDTIKNKDDDLNLEY